MPGTGAQAGQLPVFQYSSSSVLDGDKGPRETRGSTPGQEGSGVSAVGTLTPKSQESPAPGLTLEIRISREDLGLGNRSWRLTHWPLP